MAAFNFDIRVCFEQTLMYLSQDHWILTLCTFNLNHQLIFILNMCCSSVDSALTYYFVPIIHTLQMHTRGHKKLNSKKI